MIGPRTGHIGDERLSAWLSGDLPAAAAAAVRAHVAGCQLCQTSAEALRTMVDLAASLPAPDPPLTLWARIETALDDRDETHERDETRPPPVVAPARAASEARPASGGAASLPLPGSPPHHRLVWASCSGALVGAAAALAVVLGGPGRAERLHPADHRRQAAETGAHAIAAAAPTPAGAEVAEVPDPLLAEAEIEVNRAAAAYERAIDRLRSLLAQQQDGWKAEERARTADRLARLDEAIVHSRAALRRDPGNGDRADVLFSAYRRKIDFLAEAVHRGAPASGEALP